MLALVDSHRVTKLHAARFCDRSIRALPRCLSIVVAVAVFKI
jgi:hypothetical protein